MPERVAHEPLRAVALGALGVHLVLGMISLVLFLAAFQFRMDWFADPAQLISAGPTSAELLRWAAAADLLSYYLPIGVIAYVLWRTLRSRSPLVADLSSLGAGAYVVAGGIGAALLAIVGPMLMHDYAAPGADQASLAIAFSVLTEVVYHAVWQFLDPLLLATWWLGFGLLIRIDQPRMAVLSFALAATATIGAGFTVLELSLATNALLGIFFVGWTTWIIWLLLLLWRGVEPFHQLDTAGLATPTP
jgi:hypothetical protein